MLQEFLFTSLSHGTTFFVRKKESKKKVSGKWKNLKTVLRRWLKISVFDEKFCIFVTKDKTQAIILTKSYIKYLQVFDSKSDLEFLILDWNI